MRPPPDYEWPPREEPDEKPIADDGVFWWACGTVAVGAIVCALAFIWWIVG